MTHGPNISRRTVLISLGLLWARPSFALYDPKPNDLLAPFLGTWRGTLTYRDWSNPEKLVTLATQAIGTPISPNELALYFVFADGPGKTVYSYERMAFDFANGRLAWTSGTENPERSEHRIISVSSAAEPARIVFERNVEAMLERHTLEGSGNAWTPGKVEISASGAETFRNKYKFTRSVA